MKTNHSLGLLQKARKYVCIAALLTTFPLTTTAENSRECECLIIHLNNGTKVCFPLSQRPKITLTGSILTLDTEHFLISNIKKYTFGSSTDTGFQLTDDDHKATVTADWSNGRIYIRTDKPASGIQVYTVNGIRHAVSLSTLDDGSYVIETNTLPHHTYLIKVGDDTFKLQKK